MKFGPAPFHAGIADAPQGAEAVWATAPDGVRIRIGLLARPDGDTARGTVLLFPGRTEYVEKYGPAARGLLERGYACISIDWRGQGLADRPLDDPSTGHVAAFREYQQDVALMLEAVKYYGLPTPLFLLAHSMGGGIGLRSLHDGLGVNAAAFSGPMWGILLPPIFRPIAQLLAALSHSSGFGHTYVPTTKPETYVLDAPFEDNTLTRDPAMYAWLRKQLVEHPELALGGPSMTWLNEALRESRSLRALPAPDIPCLTCVGENERIVEIEAIRRVMRSWPEGELQIVQDAEHELMMEKPAIRSKFLSDVSDLFDRHR